MIDALMLFGSAARGENRDGSDVDLLAVSNVDRPFSKKISDAEIQFLTYRDLINMASNGDLFAIHLAYEGKVIFDMKGVFNEFKSKLVVRRDYGKEKMWSLDLAWYIYKFCRFGDSVLVNKRIAWCVRTVLIANAVESGRFIFSPHLLANEYNEGDVSSLIDLRRSNSTSENRWKTLYGFLRSFGVSDPIPNSEYEFCSHFSKTNNNVAVNTVKVLKRKSENNVAFYR